MRLIRNRLLGLYDGDIENRDLHIEDIIDRIYVRLSKAKQQEREEYYQTALANEHKLASTVSAERYSRDMPLK